MSKAEPHSTFQRACLLQQFIFGHVVAVLVEQLGDLAALLVRADDLSECIVARKRSALKEGSEKIGDPKTGSKKWLLQCYVIALSGANWTP